MAKLNRDIPQILLEKSHINAEEILSVMLGTLPDDEDLDIPAITALKNEISRNFSELHDGIDELVNLNRKAIKRYDDSRAELTRVNREYANSHINERLNQKEREEKTDTVDNALKYLEELNSNVQ